MKITKKFLKEQNACTTGYEWFLNCGEIEHDTVLRKLMEERLKSAITSGSGAGAVSSMSSPIRIKQRGFHFWLECEIIIYGGTESDAKVTMQGRPVQLRPDGTFTLRYGLPDGKFVFDCHAASSDGVEERVITPIVSRNTERPAPVLKTGKHS